MNETTNGRKEATEVVKDAATKATEVLKDAAIKAAEVIKDAAIKDAEVIKDAAIKAAEVVKESATKTAEVVKEVAEAAAVSMADVAKTAAQEIAIIKAEKETIKQELAFQRKKYEREIKQLAFYDALTGLPNRRKLLDRMKYSIQLSYRQGKTFAVFMLDLDKFKAVNDTLGHAAGDDLLKQVAAKTTTTLRESDMMARFGGDEFVIILENCRTSEAAEKVAANIIKALTEPFALSDGNIVQIGASIGISFYPKHGTTPEKLIDAADHALYQAKKHGRGCFKRFNIE